MTTSLFKIPVSGDGSDVAAAIRDSKNGIVLSPQGCVSVKAERERLGITDEMLERSRNVSLNCPF